MRGRDSRERINDNDDDDYFSTDVLTTIFSYPWRCPVVGDPEGYSALGAVAPPAAASLRDGRRAGANVSQAKVARVASSLALFFSLAMRVNYADMLLDLLSFWARASCNLENAHTINSQRHQAAAVSLLVFATRTCAHTLAENERQ